MTKVEEYVDTLKKIADLIPAFPNTPRGDEFVALNAKLAVLDESLTEDERKELADILDRFYAMEIKVSDV